MCGFFHIKDYDVLNVLPSKSRNNKGRQLLVLCSKNWATIHEQPGKALFSQLFLHLYKFCCVQQTAKVGIIIVIIELARCQCWELYTNCQ